MRISSELDEIAAAIHLLYADVPIDDGGIADFHVCLDPTSALRRWWRPKVRFVFDDHAPFLPYPRHMAVAVLEWGLNWCIHSFAFQYLVFHAAVIEKDGRAAVMPGLPGAGKSTLAAALVNRGWRLISDEFAVIRHDDGRLMPLARPVSLKNRSIEVIGAFAPDAVIGPVSAETHKGNVAHMRPPADSVRRMDEPALPAWVIFPRYEAGAATRLAPVTRARAFFLIADHSFNYYVHGELGFDLIGRMMDRCDCYDFVYSSLDEAIAVFDDLPIPVAGRAT